MHACTHTHASKYNSPKLTKNVHYFLSLSLFLFLSLFLSLSLSLSLALSSLSLYLSVSLSHTYARKKPEVYGGVGDRDRVSDDLSQRSEYKTPTVTHPPTPHKHTFEFTLARTHAY